MSARNKVALITGVTGQDGSYLSDTSTLVRIVQETQPDEMAGMGFCRAEFNRTGQRSWPHPHSRLQRGLCSYTGHPCKALNYRALLKKHGYTGSASVE